MRTLEKFMTDDKNKVVINRIESIIQSKKGEYLSLKQYDKIKKLMCSNKSDIFNFEPKNIPPDLLKLLDKSEMHYGFNENEIKRFLKNVNKLGYTFNYVNMATRHNEAMNHTVEPYALRKI